MEKNKVLHLHSAFSIKQDNATDSNVYIEGYASTTDVDRQGDVVPSKVWEKGMQNYLRNPIILAYHDHNNPIGRMTEHKTDSKGLWIKARISNAAKQFQLIKDGVLTAFSIGFRVLDAEYDSAAEVFLIKELELVEISVVSVPANQNTLFDLSKAFSSPADYKSFKEQFAPEGNSAKGLESITEANCTTQKEWNMNPEEIKQMLADAAKNAAEQATKSLLAQQKAEQEQKAQELQAVQQLDARIKAAIDSKISVGESGAERLLKEVEKRFEDQAEESKKALNGLEAALKEKAAELAAIQASKMTFSEKTAKEGITYQEKEMAILLSKASGRSVESTKFGRQLLEKAGGHLGGTSNTIGLVTAPASIWELEVSTNMEEEVRRRLVMAPLMRNIAMQTNVMKMPLNPEAGTGTWVAGTEFGTTASPGPSVTHVMKEITLSAYKVATREYLNYEEEEDSILVLLPIVRDAMIRRVSRSVDAAFINGNGTTAPFTGVSMYDATSAVTLSITTGTTVASVATLRALRKDLGTWGLQPQDLVFVVGNEVYYDLLDDTLFQTMDKVGAAATLLTGQVGSIGNTPVVVSGEMPAKASGTTSGTANIGAFCFAPGNFLVGNQRGLRFDTQELVETQRRVLVASLRTGLTQLTNTVGGVAAPGVSTFRWLA